jgi:demethylmenaquinone methyltransferase/2-methoxy-6-polyprenyl-1,4-benzoquinol methylase
MSSLALMRWLESSPARYDTGMRILTLGRVERLHEAVAEAATGQGRSEILEIGCGTGAVTGRLLARGARVTAVDQSPEMLEQARRRLANPASGAVVWRERTASEIDVLPKQAFDAVVASLSLSEMSRAERRFVLREAAARLRPGGRLVVADETRPRSWPLRLLQTLLRGPQRLLGWLLVGAVSSPIPDLAAELAEAGLRVTHEQRWLADSLALVAAEAPG